MKVYPTVWAKSQMVHLQSYKGCCVCMSVKSMRLFNVLFVSFQKVAHKRPLL